MLFFFRINLESVFIEQIKNKADEMLSGWSEVCSYIIGYIYNIYLLFEFSFCLTCVYLILSLTLVLGNLFLSSCVNIHANFVGNFLYTMVGSHMIVFWIHDLERLWHFPGEQDLRISYHNFDHKETLEDWHCWLPK